MDELTPEPGTMLGRYELLAPLSRGGMGTVWLARLRGSHGFEKLFALKTIRSEFARDDKFRRMFLDEARVAARIEHVNVVRIFELGEERGELYLVMDYVDGDSLHALRAELRKRGVALPLPVLLRILADVCAGLHAAHELAGDDGAPLGLVHRDVSPQNMLIGRDGSTKLIDFGVAKATNGAAGDTETGAAKGKLSYMAPEQAAGQTLDRRADVWSAGAVAYHLLEGAPVVQGTSDLARLYELISGASPTRLTAAVPPRVEQIVIQALSRDRRGRFATAAALGAAFEEALYEIDPRFTTSDVAAFVREHMRDARDGRTTLIDRARRVAVERSASGHTPSGATPPVGEKRRGALASPVGRVAITLAVGAVLGGLATLAWRSRVPAADVAATTATRGNAPATTTSGTLDESAGGASPTTAAASSAPANEAGEPGGTATDAVTAARLELRARSAPAPTATPRRGPGRRSPAAPRSPTSPTRRSTADDDTIQ